MLTKKFFQHRFILFPLLVVMQCLPAACVHRAPSTPPPPQAALPEPEQEYILRPGDELDIRFFYHPELNQTALIRADGRISLQLLGEVKAEGASCASLRRELMAGYAKQLKDPAIEVILLKSAERRVYIGGEVENPGVFPHRKGLTCLQAIFAAGGARKTARMDNVVILRDQGTSQPLFLSVALALELQAGGGGNDALLQPNDIVYVPKSTIAKLNDFVEQYIDKMVPIQRSFGLTYELNP